jgi:hypothetical protein
MFSRTRMSGLAVLSVSCLTFTPGAASACDGPRQVREVTQSSLKAFINAKQMTVLTFTGYSGAQYEDPAALRAHAWHGQSSIEYPSVIQFRSMQMRRCRTPNRQ